MARNTTTFFIYKIGQICVMPNHTHGILIIDKMDDDISASVQTLQCNVSTTKPQNQQMAKISPKSGSISTIIRSYKSVVTKIARKIHANFEWQSLFHDHIIRNDKSYQNISNYIINNPKKWNEDTFYDKKTMING